VKLKKNKKSPLLRKGRRMSEISPHEREIWKKHIIGKKFCFDNGNNSEVNFSVTGWKNGSPLYVSSVKNIFDIKASTVLLSRTLDWVMCRVDARGSRPLTRRTYGSDPRYPTGDDGEMKEWFERGITEIKRQISFLKDVYLKSSFLPPELLAHIFSFVRVCEVSGSRPITYLNSTFFSDKEKGFWEKHIFGKIIYSTEDWDNVFELTVKGWFNGSPLFQLSMLRDRKMVARYFLLRKTDGWSICYDRESLNIDMPTFGNDPKYPGFKNPTIGLYSAKFFARGIEELKRLINRSN
jgi:hypothetical protein